MTALSHHAQSQPVSGIRTPFTTGLDHPSNQVLIARNGSRKTVSIVSSVVCDNHLKEQGMVVSFHDITQQKEQENQFILTERLASIGQLAAGVSHEINNPVAFVTSNLNTLQEYEEVLNQLHNAYDALFEAMKKKNINWTHPAATNVHRVMTEHEEEFGFIRKDMKILISESIEGLDRVSEITQNLRTFSRVDKGKRIQTNINDCIRNTLKIIAGEIKRENVAIVQKLQSLPTVFCHPGQINQVLTNILVNAAHATSSGDRQGVVTIETCATPTDVIIRIADTGVGISEENLSRIFNPFFTTKPVGKGTGLGLSISYGIIKEHQGTIHVESVVNVGTLFTISLPVDSRSNNRKK